MKNTLHLGIVLSLGMLAAPAFAGEGSSGVEDNSGDWSMFGHDALGTRFSPDEKILGPHNVAGLTVLWQQPTASVVAGTPVVVGDTIFAGDTSGNVYALKASDGKVLWRTHLDGAVITSSATVLRGRVVIGDQANGFLFGLDQGNGKLLWKIRPNPLGRPAIWGSGTQVGKHVAIGVASNDEGPPPPFLSRGSLVLFDPHDGKVVWQTFTISDEDYANGSTGASIWTTPAFDAESNTIYIGTGNNFTEQATGTSDAIMAFDAGTGRIKWVNQRTVADTWTPVFPTGPDFDFGDSPQLYTLPDGRKVVGEGQKSGAYHVLDAATGEIIHSQQFIAGGLLGGLFTDSAVAGGVVFAPGNNLAASTCALIALAGDGSEELWRFETSGIEANGVAVANGVVYFKAASDPNLYALDTFTGAKLAAVPVGGSNSGPSISRGRLFLGQGDILANGFGAPGGIVALGLDNHQGH